MNLLSIINNRIDYLYMFSMVRQCEHNESLYLIHSFILNNFNEDCTTQRQQINGFIKHTEIL